MFLDWQYIKDIVRLTTKLIKKIKHMDKSCGHMTYYNLILHCAHEDEYGIRFLL